jgi:hypothetical protein
LDILCFKAFYNCVSIIKKPPQIRERSLASEFGLNTRGFYDEEDEETNETEKRIIC